MEHILKTKKVTKIIASILIAIIIQVWITAGPSSIWTQTLKSIVVK